MSVLVQQEAPSFTATAVMPDNAVIEGFSLGSYRGRYVVLFFYPHDFSAVCPSEILAFDHRLSEFRERHCDVIGISVDSHFSHLAWKRTAVDDGGIGPVRFPLVADLTKQIARDYGVLSADAVALRGTFLIDGEGIVRHQVVNDLGLGRNVGDVLRTLDALQHSERSGNVCPANWEKGQAAIETTPAGVKKFLQDFALRL
ncbi:MAG: redoxin domain-containing protein [Planctomycetota bacterium]|jgi:peroxiredoxin (alkyl hydroperoxide reductase subunit C)